MNAQRRQALGLLVAALGAQAVAHAMVPRVGAEEMIQTQALDALFPPAFGEWHIDPDVIPVEPPADIRNTIEQSYDQTLARTYVDAHGYRVMLSVAYGGRRNQGMDIHRPEICYPAQGFAVRRETRETTLALADGPLPLKRLVAGAGARNEPISYWLVIGRSVASFGLGHRLALMKYGLTGRVPDGMLVRVSSVDDDESTAFDAQDRFLRAMVDALAPDFRRRILGRA